MNLLSPDALQVICDVFHVKPNEISNFSVLKKGMTNRSFLFSVKSQRFIFRIPGEGTELLINREQEAKVFDTIRGYGMCDDPIYLNPRTGYRITRYLDNVRNCNPNDVEDLSKCMRKLRHFHHLGLCVDHTFDIFSQIVFYESLWNGKLSQYEDYAATKNNVFSLKSFIDTLPKDWCLAHIDSIHDNFLFHSTGQGEALQLIDWEYSGMQDPHVDIAMFCAYASYDKRQVDQLINIYFENRCDNKIRTKIYAYIALCGLLWSNWCEYKAKLGIEFGDYALRQYHLAKDYYLHAINRIQ